VSPAANNRPTLGEVIVRLDGLAAQIGALLDRLDKVDTTYVRQDVYEVQRHATQDITRELRTDLDAIVSQQRQNRLIAMTGLILPIVSAVIIGLILTALKP
jgi:signal transduction histidine kinase